MSHKNIPRETVVDRKNGLQNPASRRLSQAAKVIPHEASIFECEESTQEKSQKR